MNIYPEIPVVSFGFRKVFKLYRVRQNSLGEFQPLPGASQLNLKELIFRLVGSEPFGAVPLAKRAALNGWESFIISLDCFETFVESSRITQV